MWRNIDFLTYGACKQCKDGQKNSEVAYFIALWLGHTGVAGS
jgi:hypothetical protein